MTESENGEFSSEPLHIIAADCLLSAKSMQKNLLNTQGWKHFKPIAKRQKACSIQ